HRRHADRVDHRDVPVAARRQSLHLPRDEHPEARQVRVRIKRGDRQDSLHSLRTSISATASHGGLSTTIRRCPIPGGSTPTSLPLRSISRPNANRPPERGTSTSRLISRDASSGGYWRSQSWSPLRYSPCGASIARHSSGPSPPRSTGRIASRGEGNASGPFSVRRATTCGWASDPPLTSSSG